MPTGETLVTLKNGNCDNEGGEVPNYNLCDCRELSHAIFCTILIFQLHYQHDWSCQCGVVVITSDYNTENVGSV